MEVALNAMFAQHHCLRQRLLRTGAANLVERTKKDKYWGDGGNGRGLNRLGHLLMRVRAHLRAWDDVMDQLLTTKDVRARKRRRVK